MTTTPPPPPVDSPVDPSSPAPSEGGPRVSRDEVRDLGRLRRTKGDRKVAGVAGGLGRHLDIDPLILRVGFVVLAFFGGAGLILYAAGWLLVPEDDRERAPVHLDERSRTVALVALAVIAGLALIGDSWGAFWFPWPLAIIGLIAFVWLSRSRDRAEHRASAASPAAAPPAYVAPRPRDPRKRGPILFWFTLLLITVSVGVLGIIDGAGASITDSAYPALAVGVIATMLLVGSVIGRAGGLILLGLIASLVLAAMTAADRWDGETITHRPTTAAEVAETYTMDGGEMIVDLTGVSDAEDLQGRTIEVSGHVGEIVVRVPDELNVRAIVDIDGPGGYDLFGRQTGGGLSSQSVAMHEGDPDGATALIVDADLGAGLITVETE